MRIRTLTVLFALSIGLLCLDASGQTKINDLINYALEHSRDIKKSDLQYQESGYSRKEVLGKGLPQVSATGSYSRILYDVEVPQSAFDMVNSAVPANYQQMVTGILTQMDQIDGIDMASAGIQVTQLIYSQSYWTGLKTAKKAEELYSVLKEKSEEDVIAEVASGYYQAGSLMLQLQTIDKSINNLKEIYRISEASYKNDFIKESQVNRLKVTISNLEVTRQTIQNGITIQVNYLKALAGMPADSTLAIDATMLLDDFVNNSAATAFAVENVPAYKALMKQDELYGQQIKLSKATFLPTLAAFGQFNYSYYNVAPVMEEHNNMNTIGLSLSMPIFTSGSNYSKVKQAQLKQAQVKQDILKTKDLLTVSYNSALLEYQTAFNMLSAQKENLALAQKVYDQTSLLYQEGMASMADLLNVNSDFLQADNSLNQQILKCKTAEIKMLKSSGTLKSLIK
ncbi:MAG TPA: TolC family protein [Bacteroidales bacterium]|nr:TolC family protein [Bacteroidales bacterium]HPT20538.1 TolC family protein [Bacteroidales bacterium]